MWENQPEWQKPPRKTRCKNQRTQRRTNNQVVGTRGGNGKECVRHKKQKKDQDPTTGRTNKCWHLWASAELNKHPEASGGAERYWSPHHPPPLLCGIGAMMSLQTASWLRAVVCNRLVFFSSSEVYCTYSQQIRPNKQHLSEAAPHMPFYSSKTTCDHRRTKQLFLLFSFQSWRYDYCVHLVELMIICFVFFWCNSAGARGPWRGQSHYRGWRSASR